MSDFDISEIGASLVTHSQEQEISGRGLVSSLFPYIYTASKRMSTRAISAFLQEEHGVKLSAVTIAKALREPEKHAAVAVDRIEPAARVVAAAQGADVEELLANSDYFTAIRDRPPTIHGTQDDELRDAIFEYKDAIEDLEKEWFALPSDLRSLALAAWEKAQQEEDEEDAK